MPYQDIIQTLRREAVHLAGLADVTPLLEQIGDADLVLLGEATHGTHEFYRLRTELTKRLIAERDFDAIAVEADWPDALRVSRLVQGAADDPGAVQALAGFQRFPRWMWRNTEIVELVEWLRDYNLMIAGAHNRVGFFGLDLYSLRTSMESVVSYLDRVDPEAARRARARYGCFEDFGDDPQGYGYATSFGMAEGCAHEVVQQLIELTGDPERFLHHDGLAASDELFYAQQNARVVHNAENYYRSMFLGRNESWNLRDTHMADTLDALRAHLYERRGRAARIVVWAHNSHVGDARATEWYERGQLNLGQLVRERQTDPERSFLLGFTTHTGTVAAASDWGDPVEFKRVRASQPESIERVLHDCGNGLFMLALTGREALAQALAEPRLERAIGVIYRPDSELTSHYFHARVAAQFDAVVHVDHSRAVSPLDPVAEVRQPAMAG